MRTSSLTPAEIPERADNIASTPAPTFAVWADLETTLPPERELLSGN